MHVTLAGSWASLRDYAAAVAQLGLEFSLRFATPRSAAAGVDSVGSEPVETPMDVDPVFGDDDAQTTRDAHCALSTNDDNDVATAISKSSALLGRFGGRDGGGGGNLGVELGDEAVAAIGRRVGRRRR